MFCEISNDSAVRSSGFTVDFIIMKHMAGHVQCSVYF